jgi:cobalt-precorrin 5A hydrolase
MIVAGFGCRPGAAVDDFMTAFAKALLAADYIQATIAGFALPDFRATEPGATAAAARLTLTITPIDRSALENACLRAVTHSELALAHTGLSAVAESTALAAAGPRSRLLAPRVSHGSVTCALAIGDDLP